MALTSCHEQAQGEEAGSTSLLVFADDWGRHPSSCQHLIRQLLPRHRVTWVNTIGMRRPRLDRATLWRGLGKVRDWTGRRKPRVTLPHNLSVVKPVMWPWFRRPWDRRLNRLLLSRRLERSLDEMPRPVTAVTTIPIVADLISRLSVDRWVYYCVDDFSKWPGLDQKTVEFMEQRLVEQSDVLIAASRELQDRLRTWRPTVALLTHGVELSHWRENGHTDETCRGLEQPLVVFWGLVDRRLDLEFIRALSQRMSAGTIVLVGPELDPHPDLARIPRVRRIPAVSYESLPAVAAAASVLIMPYADLAVTRAMQPLKLLEYLATGRPVVVRDLPATREWSDCLDMAASADEFADAVLRRISVGLPSNQKAARERLNGEGWSSKGREFERLLIQ